MSVNSKQGILVLNECQSTRALKQTLKTSMQPLSSKDYPRKFARSTSFSKFYNNVYLPYKGPKIDIQCSDYIENHLKNSTLLYQDFKDLINPRRRIFHSLDMVETTKNRADKKRIDFVGMPKRDYEEYKRESMRILTKSRFRIEKTKQIIGSARNFTNKMIRNSMNSVKEQTFKLK